jgi:hypothetical protein
MKKILPFLAIFGSCFANTITIYNNNTALIDEQRVLKSNVIGNLPKNFIVDSFTLKQPSDITSYRYITKNNHSLFEKLKKSFLNKQVTLKNNQKVVLKYIDSNKAFVEDKNKNVFMVDIKELKFPYFPKSIMQNSKIILTTDKKNFKASFSYMLRGIKYSTNYTLNIYDKKAYLKGFFNIYNNSSQTLKADKLNFIAGDIRYKEDSPVIMYKTVSKSLEAPTPNIDSKEILSNQLYTLNKKIILNQNETTFINFINQAISYNAVLQQNLSNPIYLNRTKTTNPQLLIKFKTTKELPKGKVKIFKNDFFIGNSYINNYSKNSTVSLNSGKDFHINIEQKPIKIKKNTRNKIVETKIRYTITNNSNQEKKIILKVPFEKSNNSKVITSQAYKYINSIYLTYTLKIKPNSKKSFEATYTRK